MDENKHFHGDGSLSREGFQVKFLTKALAREREHIALCNATIKKLETKVWVWQSVSILLLLCCIVLLVKIKG